MLEVKWKELQKKESELNRGLSELEREGEQLIREAMMAEEPPQAGQQRSKDAVDASKDGPEPEQLKLVEFSTDGFTGEIKYTYKDGRLVGFSARGTTG